MEVYIWCVSEFCLQNISQKNVKNANVLLFRDCMKMPDNLVHAVLDILQCCDEVCSSALCWPGAELLLCSALALDQE